MSTLFSTHFSITSDMLASYYIRIFPSRKFFPFADFGWASIAVTDLCTFFFVGISRLTKSGFHKSFYGNSLGAVLETARRPRYRIYVY